VTWISKSNRRLDLNLNSPFATKSMKEEDQRDNFCIQVVSFATSENEKYLKCTTCSLFGSEK
ncbi:hypothetical protein S83_005813, partial [Arachis hypogaea]